MLNVALLLMPGARLFDVAIIAETWAPQRMSSPALDLDLRRCSARTGTVKLTDSAQCIAEETLDWVTAADLVLIPGLGDCSMEPEPEYLDAIRDAHQRGAVIASLCSGAFVLAKTGLLDGQTATTHWALAQKLAERFPGIQVDPTVLFVGEDRLWTSAGVAAGIDLSIHLIGQLCSASEAAMIARSMVMAPHRTGGQAQFLSSPVSTEKAGATALAAVCRLLEADPREMRTVADYAREACMAQRTFVRRFFAETGTTPHQWVVNWRISEASKLLEESAASIAHISSAVGFATPVTFRQRFKAVKGLSPNDYRHAFGQS